jgi:hypothetical protein
MSDTEPRKKRGRSPSYPAISLREAIEKARRIYDIEKRNSAPVPAIAEHLGYTAGSGSANVVISALKKFGLLEYEGSGGSRAARLTDLALNILLDERDDPSERLASIREAALKPSIHRTMWEEYEASLPSDSTLRFKLLRELGFTEGAVDDFIAQMRQTFAFAGLNGDSESDREPDALAPTSRGDGVGTAPSATTPSTHQPTAAVVDQQSAASSGPQSTSPSRAVQIPLPNGGWVVLDGPFPLTEEAWTYMTAVLAAMKPGLVRQVDVPAAPQPANALPPE